MRVLVATTAGAGHFGPLVPFAAACRDAGHDVVVAAPASFQPAVERAGFVHRPFADGREDELRTVFQTLPALSPEEANAVVIGQVFGRIDAGAAVPGVRALVADWRPDLVLREPAEFASYVVAEAEGIPHVQVAVGLSALEDRMPALVEDALTALGAAAGLAGLRSAPRLTLVPASFEDPASPAPAGIRRFRDTAPAGAAGGLPDWWAGSLDPLVYVTFGTVAAGLGGFFPGLYLDVVAALAGSPVRVLLTTGNAAAAEALRPLPANVHVEAWWPQRAVMPHAAAMVGHGGFGTTLLALSAGIPMVVLPLFADQPDNARRVEALGCGVVLDGGPAAAGRLAEAVRRVLEVDAYRMAAKGLAEEIGRLLPASASVPVLTGLAR